MIYLIPLIYAFVLGNRFEKTKNNNLLCIPYWLLCFLCILIFGFRYRVGFDTLTYMDHYVAIKPISIISYDDFFNIYNNHAPLYMLIESICKEISDDFLLLQFVVSSLFNILLFLFLKIKVPNPYYTFLVFFLVAGLYFNTDIMRESLAIMFFLFNIDNLFKKRYFHYYLLCIISIMFHYSALFLLFLPFLPKLKLDIKFFIICVCFLLIQPFFQKIFLPIITYDALINNINQYIGETQNINLVILRLINLFFIPLYFLYILKKYSQNIKHYESEVCLYTFMGIGCILNQAVFNRFTNYFVLFYCIMIADMIILSKQMRIINLKFMVVLFFILCFFRYSGDGYIKYFPYSSYFTKTVSEPREKLYEYWKIN